MATEDQEFSFPIALDHFNLCNGIDSPPLWRLSPSASPISRIAAKDRQDYNDLAKSRRRFSANGDETTEKMDVLWENFNEDLSRSRKSRLMKSVGDESMEMELNLSRNNGGKKTGKTMIVKVLKKIFWLQNNSRRKIQT